MNIMIFADQESKLLYEYYDPEQMKDIDLIISCGDLPPEYLTFFATLCHAPLLYVKGNHDGKYEQKPPEGCICIEGVEKLEAGDDRIPPDRIVAGTYLMAAAATRGEIILENPPLEEMGGILDVYRKMGGQCRRVGGKLIVNGKNTGFPLELLETEVYPGFPTDLQSPAMAVLATIPGVSRIREKIFEDRYKTASWLCKMGAQIRDGVAVIYGGQPLTGCTVEAEELRGGAALVIAALAAQGITRIRGCCFIERGYEHICEDLTALGGLLIKDRGTL